MRLFCSLGFLLISFILTAQFDERYQSNQTLTYDELIEAYTALDKKYPNAQLIEFGPTDSGRNLYLFLMGEGVESSMKNMNDFLKNKTVLLVNNGIHAGESCGIDGALLYAKDILGKKISRDVIIAIIPAYNVGGVLNRNCCTRANQDGPEEHGFRGNARNLDLNRDFIKADALNTETFYRLFHLLNPHIFVDTHTSNGADYQYTMTLISTQKDKLNPILGDFLTKEMEPKLYESMEAKGWPMVPYVNVYGNNTPDKGYTAFLETPRYASGYTALFNTIGFVTETHMLKPYKDRVESTRAILHTLTDFTVKNSDRLKQLKSNAQQHDMTMNKLDISWELDKTKSIEMEFKGYEYDFIDSEISDGKRLKYWRDKPKTYNIQYFNTYKPKVSANIPKYYVVPAAWRRVIELLKTNNVELYSMSSDSTILVSSTYVTDFKFGNRPYEGHFPLQSISTEERKQERKFLKGDVLVSTDQKNIRFIVSVLEAEAVDSYLKWNFYDEIFQQKEGFSSYVFEDSALQLLEESPDLKTKFENWKKENPKQDGRSQLQFIYKNSEMHEKEHLRYPVAKIY